MSASRTHYTGFAGVRNAVYNVFMRRSSVFALVIVALGYAGSEAMNTATERFWERANRGKLWKDLEAQVLARSAQEAETAPTEAEASSAAN
ncbi:hypothetical protein CCYA_CCYA16G4084 [Cyanidiococcus yangmingshanensis]|nr:hypothetical protein CCYA_CCYA16G4084 [Cyanidiococcus yangmingshanensis]